MVTDSYDKLRADVERYLRQSARESAMQLVRDGLARISAFEENVRRFRIDNHSIDLALESSDLRASEVLAISNYCERHALDAEKAKVRARAAFWASVSERFDACIDHHIKQLEAQADRILMVLQANGASMSADSARVWAEVGRDKEERANLLRERVRRTRGADVNRAETE